METTKTWEEVRLEKNRFYRSQFWRLQKPSIDALTSFLGFYRSQFWRLQKPMQATLKLLRSFIGHNFGDYKNDCYDGNLTEHVLSVTILETTKTSPSSLDWIHLFYRSQFWRLQKPLGSLDMVPSSFIGHNFGDYKNSTFWRSFICWVLSVTILETTKTNHSPDFLTLWFYRSQFWRLQKPQMVSANYTIKVRSYSA